MWDEDTKDQMKQQMIVDFSTQQVRTNRVTQPSSREANREKIEKAKKYGQEELDQFEEYTREYMEKISHLTMFRDLSHLVDEMFLQSFAGFISSLIKGEEIPGVPRDAYKEIRKKIFLDLIKERVEAEEKF